MNPTPKRTPRPASTKASRRVMARKQQARPSGFVLFDVFYEDGTQTSNRKVPATELGGLDGDAPARTIIEDQDQKIAEVSGNRRPRIKSMARSRKAKDALRAQKA